MDSSFISETNLLGLLNYHGLRTMDLRGQLGGSPYKSRSVPDIRGLILHHTAHSQVGAPADEARRIAEAQMAGGGGRKPAPSIQYTAGIAADGTFLLFHDLAEEPWSHGSLVLPGNENAMFLSVACFGNFLDRANPGGAEPTGEQLAAVAIVMEVLIQIWHWHPAVSLLGHRSVTPTVCPGQTLATMLRAARASDRRPLSLPIDRQQALWLMHLYAGALDGLWGPKSQRALQYAQREVGITEDGWGPVTDREIRQALAEELR